MDRKETLKKAEEIVNGEREQQYGKPEDNFKTIAEFWTTYLDRKLTAKDVAIMMILLKAARCKSGQYKDDNCVDICGYAAIANEIMSKRQVIKSNAVANGSELDKVGK